MFNVESLVDYILSTGDFTDPETRILFSEDDLIEIDETVRKLNFIIILNLTKCQNYFV